MVEEGLAGGGQRDAMNAARQQLGPDLVLQVANLPAQRRSGGVEPELGGRRQAALLDHGYEITQVPQLHSHSMPERYAPQLTKSFSRALRKPTVALHGSRVGDRQVQFIKEFIHINLSSEVAK